MSTPPSVAALQARLFGQRLDNLGNALRQLHGRDVAFVSVCCLLWSALSTTARLDTLLNGPSWSPALNNVLSMQFNGLAVLLAVTMAEHGGGSRAPAWLRYPLAVVVGVAVGTTLMWLVSQRIVGIPTAYRGSAPYEPYVQFAVRHGLGALGACGMIALVHLSRRTALQRVHNLRALQRTRADLERRLVVSRLAALRARIDPDFILRILGRVEALYEVDRAAGDRLLEAFADHLRAAVSGARQSGSTLRAELALARSWAEVVRSARSDVPPIRIEEEATDAPMPPTLLLPLLVHAVDRSTGASAPDVIVDARVAGGRVRLRLEAVAGAFADANGAAILDEVRARLQVLYGAHASAGVESGPSRDRVTLEFPTPPRDPD